MDNWKNFQEKQDLFAGDLLRVNQKKWCLELECAYTAGLFANKNQRQYQLFVAGTFIRTCHWHPWDLTQAGG